MSKVTRSKTNWKPRKLAIMRLGIRYEKQKKQTTRQFLSALRFPSLPRLRGAMAGPGSLVCLFDY